MGAVEKQTTFSHRSHRAWKTRQPHASFPQFPQSLLRDQMRRKKAKLLYCSFQPLLHFQIESARYLYPTSSCENGYRFVKLDPGALQSGALIELESSSTSFPGRNEFEAEISGIFDSNYAEDFEAFRFRIVPIEIK